MKNFKKISIVVVALSCLVETSSASLSPNYADDANVSIQSTSSGSDDLFAQLQAKIKSRSGGESTSTSGSQDELKAKLQAKMQSMASGQGSSSTASASGSQDDLKAKLQAKMQSMSGGKGQSSELKNKLKSSIMEKLKSKGVDIQSIEPQELATSTVEILPPDFAAPVEQAINPLEVTPTVEVTEEPSIELGTTLVPTNLALEPVSIPTATEETVALSSQDISEGELMIEPSEGLMTPEEETEPSLIPATELSDSLVNEEPEELAVPNIMVEDNPVADSQTEETSISQFITEDEADDSEEQNSEALPEETSVNQFLAEDEDDSEDLSILTPDLTSSTENNDSVTESLSAPALEVDVAEIPTKEVDAGIEDEIINDFSQDQPEEVIVPVMPSEPDEVSVVEMENEDDPTSTMSDDQVIIVKVYPVLDAMYSAAQSIKAAALDMIDYVFNKAKAARKKMKEDSKSLEADLKSVE